MKRVLRIVGVMAVAGALGLAGQAFANCQGEGPYSVVSCAGIGGGHRLEGGSESSSGQQAGPF